MCPQLCLSFGAGQPTREWITAAATHPNVFKLPYAPRPNTTPAIPAKMVKTAVANAATPRCSRPNRLNTAASRPSRATGGAANTMSRIVCGPALDVSTAYTYKQPVCIHRGF